ncbi:MAG: TetR/AcrR family transcriptional regulator [Phycisphaeraceae bacterium]|nr:TetR/AcrR family transcriptional regulator [Phycisphaeraceae bacterium]
MVELLGVMDVPKVGRDRLVATAVEVCYRNGFNAVGIDQILAEAGVTKTTFYKHFESKDDLLVAAIQMRDDWETKAWMRAVEKLAGEDPCAQLLAMFDVLDRWFNDPDFGGCIFINAASEYPNPNDPIHQAAAAHLGKFWDWVHELATKAAAQDPDAFADAYTMMFEGALVMRQVSGRDDAARVARENVQRLMQAYFSQPD